MPGVIQNKMAGEEDVLSKALADLNLGFEQRISIETRARSCSKSTSRRKGCVGGFTDRKLTTLCGDIHTPKRFRRRISLCLTPL